MLSCRRVLAVLAVLVVAIAGIAWQAAPSYAAVTDLYVATGGDDAGPCSQSSPCATVAAALALADLSGTTIHVGPGTFDGVVSPAEGQSVTVDGASTGATVLAMPDGLLDPWLVEVMSGTTTLSNLTIQSAPMNGIYVGSAGHLVADHVVLAAPACALTVEGGTARLTDSRVEGGPSGFGCAFDDGREPGGNIVMTAGTVSLVRSQVLDPYDSLAGVDVLGGTFTADESYFDDSAADQDTNRSNGVELQAGTVTVTRSTFHEYSLGVDNAGGTALLTDDTFDANLVGVTAAAGPDVTPTTVVRSTFDGELGSLQGSVSVAGSVLGSDEIRNCSPQGVTITDLGYNLSTDRSCGFTAGTSRQDVTDLHLDTELADRGGPVPTVAIRSPSSAVDAIPVGATYGDSATPLCPSTGATDLRGVPRPQGRSCDAGSMELAGTAMALSAPATARPHHDVTFRATVTVPDVGLEGQELPVGGVTFRSGSRVLCKGVSVHNGKARCATSALKPGRRTVVATFTPAGSSILHSSRSPGRMLSVGSSPAVKKPGRVAVQVGRSNTIRLHSSGRPFPLVRLVKGHLPPGLRFHRGHGTATIAGKARPGTAGRYHLTVEAINLMGQSRRSLTLVVRHR